MEYAELNNADNDNDSSYVNGNSDVDDDDDDDKLNRTIDDGDERFETDRVSNSISKKRPRDSVEENNDDDRQKIPHERNNKNGCERLIPLRPDELFVDWGNLMQQSSSTDVGGNSNDFISNHWIHQPLVNRNLPLIEIDKLVGYTTHITTYHHPSTNNTNANTTSTRNTSSGTTTGTNNNIGDKGRRLFHNPLLGLPNIPIRPTLLKHLILDPATKITANYIQHQPQQQSVYDNNCDDNDGDDDDDDHDDNHREANNDPRPKKRTTKKRKKKQPQNKHLYLYDRFHHSASVAIGMMVEEMITASFLPLAQEYVQYCRRVEDGSNTTSNDDMDGKLWTIPPEEAIMKIYYDRINDQGSSSSGSHVSGSRLSSFSGTSLLSTRIPTRSTVPGAIGTSIMNQLSIKAHQRITYDNWCRRCCANVNNDDNSNRIQQRQLKQLIEDDASFFQLLIQNIPTLQQADTAS